MADDKITTPAPKPESALIKSLRKACITATQKHNFAAAELDKYTNMATAAGYDVHPETGELTKQA